MRRASLDFMHSGWMILVATLILSTVGVACIYVTDTHYFSGHDGPRNAAKHAAAMVLSLVAAAVVLRVGYLRITQYAYLIFLCSLILLTIPVIAKESHSTLGGLVRPRNGAHRWINIPGLQIQPSEIMKIGYILALAWYLRFRSSYRSFRGLLIPFVATFVPAALILLQPDLGMVLLMLPVLFAMVFVAGARLRHLAVLVLIGIAVIPAAWGQIHAYQRARVSAVLLQSETLRKNIIADPERYRFLATKRQALEWAASSGYQLVHSKNAIGSGGALGYGWGHGLYAESMLLPDRHNDFVFALVGHQWGLVGCLIVLTCYGALIVSGIVIASGTAEPVGRLIAVGVVALMSAQVVINVGMTMGMLPTTGMTLPFISYGGSSLLTNVIALALLVSVGQHRPYLLATKSFEFQSTPRQRTPLIEFDKGLPGGRITL
ncbi:MAG: FtsW/RodA/SpoVE family cell cycle protein [Planctomycetota bacterium]